MLTNEDVIRVMIALYERSLREQVKQRGGQWNPERGLWEVWYDYVVALGLQARIVDSEGLWGL